MHVATAGEFRVLVADLGCRDSRRAVRVLGSVDEPEQITVVEEPEPVHLVDHGHRPGHRSQDVIGQLEADVQRLGPNMEQQVPGRCRGRVSGAVQRDERVQFGRSRAVEQPVPGVRADRGDRRQILGRLAKPGRPNQPGDPRQRVVYDLRHPGRP